MVEVYNYLSYLANDLSNVLLFFKCLGYDYLKQLTMHLSQPNHWVHDQHKKPLLNGSLQAWLTHCVNLIQFKYSSYNLNKNPVEFPLFSGHKAQGLHIWEGPHALLKIYVWHLQQI